MKRRRFIGLLGGAAAAVPFAMKAQQPSAPVIGFLNGASADGYAPNVNAFREGLKELGYVENQNVKIEYRWANDAYDHLAALANDLVGLKVSVIVANTPANLTAKAATRTIPIVFTTNGDPVQLGLVNSLARPGGNVTGVTQLSGEVLPKRLELLHELMPAATVAALLVNLADPLSAGYVQQAQSAAPKLGLQLRVLHASAESDFDAVFAMLDQSRTGLAISPGVFFINHSEELATLANRYSVPAIFEYRRFVAAGGLASYSGSIIDSYHLAGVYAGRILKGEKPADLPVQESTKVEMIINMKTAKALGITVPMTILGRADEVIE